MFLVRLLPVVALASAELRCATHVTPSGAVPTIALGSNYIHTYQDVGSSLLHAQSQFKAVFLLGVLFPSSLLLELDSIASIMRP